MRLPECQGGFVPDENNWNRMCNYHPLADAMGNTVAVIDSFDGEMQPQHFDAFGCNVNNTYAYSSAPKCGDSRGDPPEDLNEADGQNETYWIPDGLAATSAERLSAGRQQWRGHEGSQTDLAGWDQFDNASPVKNHKWAAHSRPSTGLVYMQARYYDPEVGRFTQWDPVPYGPEMAWGQNNRWVYCANDPVNLTDPSGNIAWMPMMFAIGFAAGAYLGLSAMDVPGSLGLAVALGAIGERLSQAVSSGCQTRLDRLQLELMRMIPALAAFYGLFGAVFWTFAAPFLAGFAAGLALGVGVGLLVDARESEEDWELWEVERKGRRRLECELLLPIVRIA